MARIAQLGIVLGALGLVLLVMGLFPGVTGLSPTAGVGLVQLMAALVGYALIILGALIYVKFTFYPNTLSNLWQQIGSRLALTGIVFAMMCGLADVLGFGSQRGLLAGDVIIGQFQIAGIIGSFLIASLGVLVYTLTGDPES
jgi:tellurite resistance protein TehA-like permease